MQVNEYQKAAIQKPVPPLRDQFPQSIPVFRVPGSTAR